MDTGIHSTRNVLVVKQQPNLVLLQVGSNANLDTASAQPSTGRAIIKVFDMSKAPSSGYNYKTDGEVFGYGLRNEIGFTADPNGVVWGVENSGDVSNIPDLLCCCLAPGNGRTSVTDALPL
jgi:glucose/arabinose dehydrogenase